MVDQIKKIKVFVASPGDVQSERQQLSTVIEELNSTVCREKGLVLELLTWKTYCHPAIGRPQEEINKQIGLYDLFVGIMWKRFGTPTGKAESGTEEEFMHAYANWESTNTPQILLYFCKSPCTLDTQEEVEQLSKVIKFREEVSRKGLVWEYSDRDKFADIIRPHLINVLGDIIKLPYNASHNLLLQVWDNMEPDLQDIIAIAYNNCRRIGSNTIKTRDLFAAMMKLRPERLDELLQLLPQEALPEPMKESDTSKKYILREEISYSGCVMDTLEHIGYRATPERKLSIEDVFVDIAKHGTGESVYRLRTYGVSPVEVEQLVKQLGWHVIER